MLTPAAKRRRAEAASATLSRPFRSPAVRGKSGGAGTALSTPSLPGLAAQDTRTGPPGQGYKRPRQLSVSGAYVPASQSKRLSKRSSPLPPAPVSLDGLIDEFTLELDAGDIAIEEAQLRHLETRADKKEKAPGMYDEMPALITKWREAGRLAAEEVYGFVSQRIAGAGGIKAWRAMAAAPPQEDDCRDGSGDGVGGDEDGEDQKDREDDDDDDDEGEQSRREREREVEEAKEEQERAEAETSQNFTMATMLANLNVEPDLLDYDEAEERWRD